MIIVLKICKEKCITKNTAQKSTPQKNVQHRKIYSTKKSTAQKKCTTQKNTVLKRIAQQYKSRPKQYSTQISCIKCIKNYSTQK